jgi:hypothetical protein
MFVGATFAGNVRDRLIDPVAATTAENLRTSPTLFRLGVVSDLVQITCMLLAGLLLYQLLRHVHAWAATAMVTFVAVAVAIGSLNLLNLLTALNLATGEDAAALGTDQRDALTTLFLDRHEQGYYLSAMFWGLWLLPLGYLLIRSAYVPRILGMLLVAGGVSYLVDLTVVLLAPDLGASIGTYLLAVGGVAEFLLALWLVVRAVHVPETGENLSTPTSGRSAVVVR